MSTEGYVAVRGRGGLNGSGTSADRMTDKKGIILYENEQAKIHLKQVLCFNNFVKFNLCYPRT